MELQPIPGVLPPSTERGLDLVRRIEDVVLQHEQIDIPTQHVFHAGVYARTICIPAGTVLTSALISIPTLLIVNGRAAVLFGDGQEVVVEGYQVLPAAPGRKVAYIAQEDTHVTMVFQTEARTVAEAEAQFTPEADRLMSRSGINTVVIGDQQ